MVCQEGARGTRLPCWFASAPLAELEQAAVVAPLQLAETGGLHRRMCRKQATNLYHQTSWLRSILVADIYFYVTHG